MKRRDVSYDDDEFRSVGVARCSCVCDPKTLTTRKDQRDVVGFMVLRRTLRVILAIGTTTTIVRESTIDSSPPRSLTPCSFCATEYRVLSHSRTFRGSINISWEKGESKYLNFLYYKIRFVRKGKFSYCDRWTIRAREMSINSTLSFRFWVHRIHSIMLPWTWHTSQ